MNLRLKLLMPLALCFALVAAYLQFIALPDALFSAQKTYRDTLTADLKATARAAAPAVASGDSGELASIMQAISTAMPAWKRLQVEDVRARVLWQSPETTPGPEHSARSSISRNPERINERVPVVDENATVLGYMSVQGVDNPALASVRASFEKFLLILSCGLLLSLGLAAFLLGPIVITPIRELVKGAERLANRDFRNPVNDQSSDDVGRLAKSFNSLRTAMRDHELDQRKSAMAIQELAHYDEVTGLPNKAFLYSRLATALENASDTGTGVALMFVDIENFTSINDLVGYDAGDRCLREVAHRIVSTVCGAEGLLCDVATMRDGATDGPRFVARYSADAFLMLFTDLPRNESGDQIDAGFDLEHVARRVQTALLQGFNTANRTFSLSTNIGVSRFPDNGLTAIELLQHAGTALNAAKNDDSSDVRFFTDTLNATTFRRLSLQNGLGEAARNGEMSLNYQTKVDLRSGVITGVEALARWEHPQHGNISPAEFIPLSEQSGKIVDIGQWVIATACAQSQAWASAGLPPMRVAVNVSSRQILHGRLIDDVRAALDDSGLAPSLLEIELTESTLMARPEQTADVLDKLKELGVSISVDDFGTGYSSLSYLHRFPLDALKIDRSFVATAPEDENSKAIIRAIVSMARGLDLAVIAEGVETEDQLGFLVKAECDDVQGFLLSKPVTPVMFEQEYERTVSRSLAVVQEQRTHLLHAGTVA